MSYINEEGEPGCFEEFEKKEELKLRQTQEKRKIANLLNTIEYSFTDRHPATISNAINSFAQLKAIIGSKS